MGVNAAMGAQAVPPSHHLAATLAALVVTLSCGSPGRPTTPSSGASLPCSTLGEREPGDVILTAWDATERAEVRRLLGFGVPNRHQVRVPQSRLRS